MTHPETPPAKTRNTTHWKAVAQAAIKAREDWQRQYADEADRTDKLSNALADALEAKGWLERDKADLETGLWLWQRIAIAFGTLAVGLALWLVVG